MFLIYKVTNKINGKVYVGQTSLGLKRRKSQHIIDVKNNKSNCYFHNSIRKYGEENFTWMIIEKCKTKNEANLSEEWFIRYLNSYKPNGYNLTFGGEGTLKRKTSQKTRERLSRGVKGWWDKKDSDYRRKWGERISKQNTGKKRQPVSVETREKLRIANIGKKHSEEHKEKISKSLKGRVFSNEHKEKIRETQIGEKNSFFGKTHTEEARKKMSHKGKKNPFFGKTHSREILEKKSKCLWQITHPNGKIVTERVLSLWCKENNKNYRKKL